MPQKRTLVLFPNPRQPFATFILAHLSEQSSALCLTLRHRLIHGTRTDSNLDFPGLEVCGANGGEGFDCEFYHGRTVQFGF